MLLAIAPLFSQKLSRRLATQGYYRRGQSLHRCIFPSLCFLIMNLSNNFDFGFSKFPRLGGVQWPQRVYQAGVNQADPSRSAREVFTTATQKGNRIPPHRTRRGLSYGQYTVIRNAPQIHTRDLRTIEHNLRRHCTRDLHDTGELKRGEGRQLLTTSRSLTTYHPRNHLARRYDYEKPVWSISNMPPFHLVQTKQKAGRLEE
jgi:hypothetical protein